MPRPAPPARSRRATLPTFTLYGEAGAPGATLLHIESIQSRSKLYEWEIDSHVHHGLHQLVWVHRGPVRAVLDESHSEGEGPLVVVIPPGVAHAFRFAPDTDGHVLTMDARRLAEGDAGAVGAALQALFTGARTLRPLPHEAARLHGLFETLLAESPGDDASPVAAWLARALVWRLAELARRGAPDAARAAGRDAHYTRWVVLMEAHYLEHWPVTRYAERLGLSVERLNRIVRAETGMNAQALLHARLVSEARRRLVHLAAPVSRIGFELGFDDPAYFCRFFKRHAGRSPRAYRAEASRGRG
jgi:AraC family transcriptional activator of pobA